MKRILYCIGGSMMILIVFVILVTFEIRDWKPMYSVIQFLRWPVGFWEAPTILREITVNFVYVVKCLIMIAITVAYILIALLGAIYPLVRD